MRGFGGMISLHAERRQHGGRAESAQWHETLFPGGIAGRRGVADRPSGQHWTHASIPREERLKNGLIDSLIRLSVGIEDAADLMRRSEKGHRLILADIRKAGINVTYF